MFGIMKYSSDLLDYGISFLLCCSVINASTIYCPPPDVPANGVYEPKLNMFLPGSNVSYVCNEDFVLDGSSIRECQIDGTWSQTTPFCDQEKTFKILRGSMSDYGVIDYIDALHDGNTCYTLCCENASVRLELEKEVVVRGVKISVGTGFEDTEIYTKSGNNTTLCASHKGYSSEYRWLEFNCGSDGVLADETEIPKEMKSNEIYIKAKLITLCGVRVLGFGRQFDYGCTIPPEITVENGYFEVNRTKATLICEDGYTSENGGLDCGTNSWKGLAPRCEKVKVKETPKAFPETNVHFQTSTNISANMQASTHLVIAVGVGVAAVLILVITLGIVIYFIRKQKATERSFHSQLDRHLNHNTL